MSTGRLLFACLVLAVLGSAAGEASGCCLTDWLFGRTSPYVAGYAPAVPTAPAYTAAAVPVTAARPVIGWPSTTVMVGETADVDSGAIAVQRPSYYDNPSVYTGRPVVTGQPVLSGEPVVAARPAGAGVAVTSPGAALPATSYGAGAVPLARAYRGLATTSNPFYGTGNQYPDNYQMPAYASGYRAAAPAATQAAGVVPVVPRGPGPIARGLARFFGSSLGTSYTTSYYRAPVTYYRPVTSVDPVTGTTVTVQRPCTSSVQMLQRTPYRSLQTSPTGPMTAPSSACPPPSSGSYPSTQYPSSQAPPAFAPGTSYGGTTASPPAYGTQGGYGGQAAPPTASPGNGNGAGTASPSDRSPVDQPQLQSRRPPFENSSSRRTRGWSPQASGSSTRAQSIGSASRRSREAAQRRGAGGNRVPSPLTAADLEPRVDDRSGGEPTAASPRQPATEGASRTHASTPADATRRSGGSRRIVRPIPAPETYRPSPGRMRADSDDDESSDDRSSELTPPSFTTRRSLDAGRQNDRHSLQAPPLPRRSGKDRSQVDDAEDPGRETYRRRGTGRPAVRQPTRVREASLVRRTGDASMTQPERRSARRPPAESGWYSP